MEVSSDDSEIPIPLNSTITSYGHGGHMIHRDNPTDAVADGVATSLSNHQRVKTQQSLNGMVVHTSLQDHPITSPYNNMKQQPAKYKECLKNHAAAIGGNATDGCGEFMPSGEEATIEALTCSACHCHRNFHRKQVEEDHNGFYHNSSNNTHHLNRVGRRVIFGGNHKSNLIGYPTTYPAPHQMIMSHNIVGGLGYHPLSESDEQEGGVVGAGQTHNNNAKLLRKRFRTKFTHEQKEKMFSFAEKVGWKIQKQDEAVVQQLCHEIGVKRRVLKVWMHNNKHNLAKHNPSSTLP